MGTVNILESMRLAARKPWLILASTREIGFNWNELRSIRHLTKLNSLYAMSKLMAESICYKYSNDYQLNTVVLRFSDVYGAQNDDTDKVLPKIILRLMANEDVVIHAPQKQFDFIHYTDIVRGIRSAMNYMEKPGHRLFNYVSIATGKTTTLRELARLIKRKTRSRGRITYLSDKSGQSADGLFVDAAYAKKLFGFTAKVPLSEGIRRTIKNLKIISDV
jgi:UDP-glucose 4-epimerase